tara:strand:+ start:25757 stop:26557 length:801 start_codon:yes stop_codon:yes gene_type:complete
MNMNFNQLLTSFTQDHLHNYIYAALYLIAGWILAKFASHVLKKLLNKRVHVNQLQFLRRTVFFLIFFMFLMAGLQQIGFKISALLATAGIFSIAITYASQSSISNIVSGLFLFVERSFRIGDAITVNSVTGTVLSIDLMSVKLKTFDNKFVRVPNESIIKSVVVNLTKYDTRRFDIDVGVAYDADLNQITKALLQAAKDSDLCLADPEPVVLVNEFDDSSISTTLRVWCNRPDILDCRTQVQSHIKIIFAEQSLDIPFPQRVIHQG